MLNSDVLYNITLFWENGVLHLEVCGIMVDVYVSQYRNVHGHRFGFVKFVKVRDVAKLNKALNNVYFGDLRLFANVAKFDRFVKEEERMEDVVGREQRWSSEGEKNIGGVKVGKKQRELEVERLGNRKLELEKVKEAAIRSQEQRLHDVFHVSQLRKYVPDPSHVIQSDDVQVRDNLTVETLPVRIDDRKVKTLRGKEIPLVRVVTPRFPK